LGIGEWAQSPIPNPQSPNINKKSNKYNLNKVIKQSNKNNKTY